MTFYIHPLYTALDRLMERDMSRKQQERLLTLFKKHSLELPVDFEAALLSSGFIL